MSIENMEEAFDSHRGSCRGTCCCGREFYNSNGGWDFEEGELKELEANKNAIDLDWTIGFIELEGNTYIKDCNCWKKRALAIMKFLDAHNFQIAEYLSLEKKRKQKEAEDSPVVEEGK